MAIALLLIDRGADVHATDSTAATPLLVACSLQLTSVVDYLMVCGADLWPRRGMVHSKAAGGRKPHTPYSLIAENGWVPMMERLLRRGILASPPPPPMSQDAIDKIENFRRAEIAEERARQTAKDAAGAVIVPPKDGEDGVVARYRCIRKTVIREACELHSEKVGELDIGTVVDALEEKSAMSVAIDPGTGLPMTSQIRRVRLDGGPGKTGWVSKLTGAGVEVLTPYVAWSADLADADEAAERREADLMHRIKEKSARREEKQMARAGVYTRGQWAQAVGEGMICAAAHNHVVMIDLLVANLVPVDARDPKGFTALAKSVDAGHHLAADRLLEHGASLTFRLPNGGTAFHLAAHLGRTKCGEVLLRWATKRGLTGLTLLLRMKNKHGRNPIELAQLGGHDRFLELIDTFVSPPGPRLPEHTAAIRRFIAFVDTMIGATLPAITIRTMAGAAAAACLKGLPDRDMCASIINRTGYDPDAAPPGCDHGMFVASAISADDVGPKPRPPLSPSAELQVEFISSEVAAVPRPDRFIDPRTLLPFKEDRLYTFHILLAGEAVERIVGVRHAELKERHDALVAKPVDEAKLQVIWEELDADGSGALDEAELGQVFLQMGRKVTEKKLARSFRMMDKDRSGSVEPTDRDCYFADTPSPHVLKRLLEGEGGAAE